MQERIQLLKAEVEGRGSSWLEFSTVEELTESTNKEGEERLVNGTGEGHVEGEGQERSSGSNPWADGTFQTGRIVNGEMQVDGNQTNNGPANGTSAGGRVDDEALRRAMEERMRALATDDDEGMHL